MSTFEAYGVIVAGFIGILLVVGALCWSLSDEMRQNKRARLPFLLILILLLSLTNFMFGRLLIIDFWIGGDATGGKIEAGRYFVSSYGIYTEVSRTVYSFTAVYDYLTNAVLGLSILVTGLYFCWAARRARREFKQQIVELRAQDDIQALYDLIEMIDFAGTAAVNSSGLFRLPVDLEELRVAIDEKTRPVMQKEETSLTLSPQRTSGGRIAQKEVWLQWANSHQKELREYLATTPPDDHV